MSIPAAAPRRSLRIGIVLDGETPARGTLQAAEAVQLALRDLGHAPLRVPLSGAPDAWLARVSEASLDLLFNLCGRDARIAAALELLVLPMTGCGSELLALARRPARVRALLRGEDVPIAGRGGRSPHGREISVGIVGERVLTGAGGGVAPGEVEVRPNPELSPSARLPRLAAAAGWGYVDLIGGIVKAALA